MPQIRNEDGGIATSLRCEPSLGATWAQAILGPALAARFGVGEMIARRNVYAQRRSVDWATGAILLVTARARKLVGHWDESFFLYSEEVDFQRRVRAHGLTVAYEPEAQVVHIGGDYMQSPPLTALMTSNQIRYFARHHGPLSTMLFRAPWRPSACSAPGAAKPTGRCCAWPYRRCGRRVIICRSIPRRSR